MGKKSKSETKPWAPAQPMLLGAGQGIMDTVNGNAGNLKSIESGLTGSVIPGIQSTIDKSQAQLQPGMSYLNNVLGGQYLNSNPYVQQMADYAGQQAGNAVNSTFSSAGRTGSMNHATALARGVDQAQNGVLFQNYQNERANQQAAAGMLPSYSSAQFTGYTPLIAANELAGQLPYFGTDSLGKIGGLYSGYGTTTQKDSLGKSLMNAAAAAAAAYAQSGSDPRLKQNIELVGKLDNGLGVYEWEYRHDKGVDLPEGRFRGVMADEVAKVMPWMLGTPVNGYLTVRYTPERIG